MGNQIQSSPQLDNHQRHRVSDLKKMYLQSGISQFDQRGSYKQVAPPELKISPIMNFVIHNSVVLSKILKIVVPQEQNFENLIFDSIKLIILILIVIDKQESEGHNDFQYFG